MKFFSAIATKTVNTIKETDMTFLSKARESVSRFVSQGITVHNIKAPELLRFPTVRRNVLRAANDCFILGMVAREAHDTFAVPFHNNYMVPFHNDVLVPSLRKVYANREDILTDISALSYEVSGGRIGSAKAPVTETVEAPVEAPVTETVEAPVEAPCEEAMNVVDCSMVAHETGETLEDLYALHVSTLRSRLAKATETEYASTSGYTKAELISLLLTHEV